MWRSGLPGGLRAVFGGSPLSSGGSPRVLEGKVALVTAGTDGIGLGVAEALGVAGAQVLLSSRHAHNVQRAVEQLRGRGLQVSGVTCHVGRAEDRERMVQAALDTFGAIDILVSNAAVNPHLGPALEADERIWEKVFQVNVTAAAMLVRLVVPHMERRGCGRTRPRGNEHWQHWEPSGWAPRRTWRRPCCSSCPPRPPSWPGRPCWWPGGRGPASDHAHPVSMQIYANQAQNKIGLVSANWVGALLVYTGRGWEGSGRGTGGGLTTPTPLRRRFMQIRCKIT
ncbi:dehydrogenase/reductase SDR family member 4-like isoform X2 [Vidua chalybeata]|uniref:dehydrogenase/reductase SDR family member 4-like isoform X2 n=1 Tax=Vidua chalybeata TaxID=81927 RepID=UPI0023A86400|nr:dehydrogenase/reductase SDR family member 4-like isoform X2 [Vidua chalybeata]